jgi:hypothetical protein
LTSVTLFGEGLYTDNHLEMLRVPHCPGFPLDLLVQGGTLHSAQGAPLLLEPQPQSAAQSQVVWAVIRFWDLSTSVGI